MGTDSGMILRALSGFYYVYTGTETVTCRARGKFRHQRVTPLVGDRVRFTDLGDGTGALDEILPRVNQFQRPAVANIDQLVILASGAIPVTDPFLIDRMTAIADGKEGCGCVICINKCDLDAGDCLYDTYTAAGFPTLRVSAETGEGMDRLADTILLGAGNLGRAIVNHTQPADGVARVDYADGVTVVVNYGKEAYAGELGTVGPEDFAVFQRGEGAA